jgi:nicotinate-nucleotide pyrophosphorylase (carboxylating)
MTREAKRTRADYSFGDKELSEAQWLLRKALEEDQAGRDRTSEGLLGREAEGPGAGLVGRAAFVPRGPAAGILCGLPVVEELFRSEAPEVTLEGEARDGDPAVPGEAFLEVAGPATAILRLERIALNVLGRLSGVATVTARWVAAVAGAPVRILDTRKTTPGWRYLEKYAVRVGGGHNHRLDLADGLLVKDNHVAFLRGAGLWSLGERLAELRRSSPGLFLEVEVDTREELLEALAACPDAILLDNFPPADLAWAVEARNRRSGPRPLLEASGGIRLETLRAVAATGVDRISAGSLTHSAPALDIGLDVLASVPAVDRRVAPGARGGRP